MLNNEETKEDARSGILGRPGVIISQAVLAVIWFVLRDFFSPTSFLFWLSTVIILFAAFWLVKRQYKYAVSTGVAWLALIISVSLATNAIILSDQSRWRYRNTTAGSFVEVPASPIVSRIVHSFWSDRNIIEITACNQNKIAKLPLLPYPTITAVAPEFPKTPFVFRRLPPARIKEVEVLVVIGKIANKRENIDEDQRSIEAGFRRNNYAPYDITSIFPRNISCNFSKIVGIPILEYLPWNPENVESFFLAARLSQELRQIYYHGTFTAETLRYIHEAGLTDEYRPLFEFVLYRLATKMLQGNIAAELRADLRNHTCLVLASAPKLFDGSFSSLRNQFFEEIATIGGRDYRQMFEACHVPEQFIANAETNAQEGQTVPRWVQGYANCIEHSDSREKFAQCLGNIASQEVHQNERSDLKQSPGPQSSEALMRFLEEPYSRFVVNANNVLEPVSKFGAAQCPALRDRFEEGILLNHLLSRSSQIFQDSRFCTARDDAIVQSKIAEFREVWQCGMKRGVLQERSDDWIDDYITQARITRCGDQISLEELSELRLYKETKFTGNEIVLAANAVRQFSFLLKEKTINEIASALDIFAETVQALCGDNSFFNCMTKYLKDELPSWLNEPRLAGIIKLAEQKGLLQKGLVTQQSTPRQWIEASPNRIVHIIVCNALADEKIAALIGLQREEFCRSRGLSRYMRVADTLIKEARSQWWKDKEDPRQFYESYLSFTPKSR